MTWIETLVLVGYGLIFSMVAGLIGYMLWLASSFKHTIHLRRITSGNRKIVYKTKFKEFTAKDGAKYWRLMKAKYAPPNGVIPAFPDLCCDTTPKGNLYAEAYWTKENEIIPINDDSQVDGFQPMTINQRQIMINQIKKANDKRSKDWKEVVLQMGPVVMLGLVLIMGMVMWADLNEPALEMRKQEAKISEAEVQQLRLIEQINSGIQRIESGNAQKKEQQKPD